MAKKSRQPLNLDHLERLDRPTRERIYQLAVEEEARERSRALESRGWRAWYGEMFDIPPSEENPEGIPFVSRLAPHHIEAIEWHWNSLIMKRAGLDIIKYIYFAIWSRGHMKSTIARYIAICDAALSGKGYCLYVSGTKGKVRGHAISIETLLGSAKIKEYYPKLATVMRGEAGQSKGWQANFIYTESGYVFHFVSLDEGIAGANIDSVRPTLIIPDDVDDRDDSVVISQNRMRVLTRAVLPTRQHNTLVLWAQNLISRHSVLYHVYTGKEVVLTARVNTKPIPAFLNLRTERRVVDGIIKDIIIDGEPTWPWYDRKRAQEEIDTIGLSAFLAECQHEVDQDLADAILPEFNEQVHLITWEEFNAVYGLDPANRDLPAHWRRYVGHDWGSTGQAAGHANVVGWVGVSAANSHYPGTAFFYHVKSFPASTLAGTVARSILNYVLWSTQRDPQRYIELGLLDRGTADPSDVLAKRARDKVTEELGRLESYSMWHMSHEAKAVRDIYRMVYGLPFQPCVDGGEVLTANGWVSIQDVEVGDYVYSCDLQGVLSLKRVEATQHNFYKGPLVKVRSKGLYQSFTPDHQVMFRNDNKGTSKEKWRLARWSDIQSKTVDMIRAPLAYEADGEWEPPVACVGKTSWLAFLGLWLAEGSLDTHGNGVRITQCSPGKQEIVEELLGSLPWKFTLYRNGDFVTSDAALHAYLKRFGKAHQKYVPREILQHADTAELEILLHWLMFGDGSGGSAYYTTSTFLADDVSEIALKLGWKVYKRDQPCHCAPVNSAHRPAFVINVSKSRFPSTKVAKAGAAARLNSSTEFFEGMVYDLTVEDNHSFVIRQQGRVWISGNCNPKRDGGVAQLRHYLRYDMSQPHPFRPGRQGLSRMYIIVENDAERERPTGDAGMQIVREQLPEWRMRPPELTSQGFLDERPMKINDDVGNMLMMIFTHFRLQATPLTATEQLVAAIPPELRYENLLAQSPYLAGLTPEQEMAHLFAVQRARRIAGGAIERFDEHGQPIRG